VRTGPRRWLKFALALGALSLAASCMACSPVYVVKAGIAEVGILRARRPISEVLGDSLTSADTRAKLTYVMHARRFASDELDIDVGDSYTMFTQLDRDTLALVVSAAPKDQLGPVTWWFPIVGRVPYRGFFSVSDALDAAADLEEEGYDTYVRPTAAFSTLGWFNDPVLSTMLNTDDVEVVQTVLHELAHQYLFVPGHVGFNEAFANFVGRVAAIQFFCTREGGGPDTVKCIRAQERWRDFQRFSVFMDDFTSDLEQLYYDPNISFEDKVARREPLFEGAMARFESEVQPTFESITFSSFLTTPMNNATLMGRVRYYNRLQDFQALLDAHEGDLTSAMEQLRAGVGSVEDPWDLVPHTSPAVP
jgi:predicted aminopeptidase